MKAKELIRKIEAVGWVFVRQTGSHKIFKKDGEAELITVPEHGSRDLKKPLVLSIFKKAGLRQ